MNKYLLSSFTRCNNHTLNILHTMVKELLELQDASCVILEEWLAPLEIALSPVFFVLGNRKPPPRISNKTPFEETWRIPIPFLLWPYLTHMPHFLAFPFFIWMLQSTECLVISKTGHMSNVHIFFHTIPSAQTDHPFIMTKERKSKLSIKMQLQCYISVQLLWFPWN